MSNSIKAIGLFGTCGSSTWRAPFIEAFEAEGIEYFNPQVDDWTPELASVEARHLAGDAIITMVVTGETTDRPCGAVFVAIGHKPNTDLFKGQLPLNEAGYLLTEGRSSRTAVEGVFACGDVQDWVYRQAITAAGSGCAAAIDCERWLEAQNF